ncbi:putative transcription factor C2C2-GATA family [Helianthus annuus]|uniref:Putative zinc finger, NHR/GATA-type n=1 Tax=Helianthus annuus TaxID=4232 RepID=A0A251UGA4_HELAN|nr:GATA transcription factor 15 [Helianthus annuus]KAF5801029.1 putative transcription factor C2C2-GATA family [Helianthus annuus]KAJ0565336.1 putative transcription factor C2C2-GATA family [Helianthus annuus]KAJ0572333.1 putative transcription factor C2C2-GATA family [Helianthus annuus]KAJ0736784.1 putative transcription factor C2C2-GATA family [Helianthus annuus]KAJ0910448.1 putative transcription factor C2C2-GATA family [Helianthus annuus]
MDPNDKRSDSSQAEDVTESSNEKKCCTDCHTTRTPLWRGGPAGPKSLCNACGIKYNKKRRQQIDKTGTKTSKVLNRNGDLKMKMKMKLMVINQNQSQSQSQTQTHHNHDLQRSKRKRSSYERGKPWWNKLREEEQAAILLMAISCGGCLY